MAGAPPRPTTRDLLNQFITLLLLIVALSISLTYLFFQTPQAASANAATIVIVWSGMRPDMVSADLTPRLLSLGDEGVVALDHHAVFPTSDLVQAATLATGLAPGSSAATASGPGSGNLDVATPDPATGTGVLGDAPYWVLPGATVVTASTPTPPAGTPTPPAGTPTAVAPTPSPVIPTAAGVQQLRNDAVLQVDQSAVPGGVLVPPTLATALLQAGLGVSYQGQGGQALLPTLMNVSARATPLFVIDDSIVYPAALQAQLPPGTGASVATDMTQAYLKTLLPSLIATHKPFFSFIAVPTIAAAAATSGLGSPDQLAAIRDADHNLGELLDSLNGQGILGAVNIIVTSDHGLLGVLAPSSQHLADQSPAATLGLSVAARMRQEARRGTAGLLPDVGTAGIADGSVTADTTVLVAAQEGTDAITFPETPAVQRLGNGDAAAGRKLLAREVVDWWQTQSWAGPLFVNDRLGSFDGTLPFHAAQLAHARAPALIATFASTSADAAPPAVNPENFAGSGYADGPALASSGGPSRRELHTIFYALGPSFRSQIRDLAPTGAVDLAPTIARVMGIPDLKGVDGRVMSEILNGGEPISGVKTVNVPSKRVRADGSIVYVLLQLEQAGSVTYFAGAGLTIGQPGDSDATLQQRVMHQLGP